MPTVYEILNIAPTDNYNEIKKAYFNKVREYYPDKNPDDVAAAAERFKSLAKAYGQVNNAEEAKLFFTWFKQQDPAPDYTRPRTSSFTPSSMPSSSHDTPELAHVPSSSSSYAPSAPDEGIRAYTEEKVDVFMVIGVNALLTWEGYGKEWSPAAFSFIAARLESLCQKNDWYRDRYVGVTSEDAIKITNEHSHCEGGIVVHFQVRLADLSEQKASEWPLQNRYGVVHACGSKAYFQLLENTKFSADDIISFRPMVLDFVYGSKVNEYNNTVRFICDEFIAASKRWPGAPLVVNPSSQLTYGALQPTVSVTLSSNNSPSSSSASVVPYSIFPAAPDDSFTELRSLISGYKSQNSVSAFFSSTIPKLLRAQTIREIGGIAHAERNVFLPRSEKHQRLINTLAQLKDHPEKVQAVIVQLKEFIRPASRPSSSPSSGFH